MSHENGLSIEEKMFDDSIIARTLVDTPDRAKTRNELYKPEGCYPVSRRYQKRVMDRALEAPTGAITSKSAKMPIDDESKDYSTKADRKLDRQERHEKVERKIEKQAKKARADRELKEKVEKAQGWANEEQKGAKK